MHIFLFLLWLRKNVNITTSCCPFSSQDLHRAYGAGPQNSHLVSQPTCSPPLQSREPSTTSGSVISCSDSGHFNLFARQPVWHSTDSCSRPHSPRVHSALAKCVFLVVPLLFFVFLCHSVSVHSGFSRGAPVQIEDSEWGSTLYSPK